jgi:nitroreductase
MDFNKLVKERKTTFEFSDKAVSDKDINLILEAGRWSPSCTNTQPWHFIVVKDKERIEKILRTANYGFFHTEPNAIIAVVLITEKCKGPNHSCFRGKDSGVHDSHMSIGMSVYGMSLQAKDLGIDSCIITPEQKEVKKILKVKKEDAVPLFLGLGYENKNTFKRDRTRLELKEITSKETFTNE